LAINFPQTDKKKPRAGLIVEEEKKEERYVVLTVLSIDRVEGKGCNVFYRGSVQSLA
jgi:hypothetical protein